MTVLAANSSTRPRWAVAAIGGAAVVALMLVLFRTPIGPTTPVPAKAPRPPAIDLVKAGAESSALAEQTVMRDTTPLFLPTEHNATVGLPRREPGKTFLESDPLRLNFGEAGLNLAKALPPAATLNGKPMQQAAAADLLTGGSSPPLLGFGRTETPAPTVPERGAFIEVVSTATGERILAEALPIAAAPPTDKEWQPMEFLAAVAPAGLVGPLVVVDGSRVEEVDAYFGEFLSQQFRIGAHLPPGFYRVIVAP